MLQELIKMEKKLQKNISYILQFIDSSVFMASSLSNLANNLSERIHRIKCKFGRNDQNCETCGIKYKNYYYFLKYKNFKDNLIEYKSFRCKKSYQNKFDKKLHRGLFKTYKFSNHDTNKFLLLLRRYLSLRIYG